MNRIQANIPDSQCNFLGSMANTTGKADWIDEAGKEYDRCIWYDDDLYRYESKEDFEAKNPIPMYVRDVDGIIKPNLRWIAAPFRTLIWRQRGTGDLFIGCHSMTISEESCCQP